MLWFNKPPRVGTPTPPHQDGYYLMLMPNKVVRLGAIRDKRFSASTVLCGNDDDRQSRGAYPVCISIQT